VLKQLSAWVLTIQIFTNEIAVTWYEYVRCEDSTRYLILPELEDYELKRILKDEKAAIHHV
jgi:hypothetical protein